MHTLQAEAAPDIDFSKVGEMGDALLERLRDMREADPIYYSRANGGVWVVTGHDAVAEGFGDKLPLSAVRLPELVVTQIPPEERAAKIPYLMATTPQWLINMDRPRQTRLRNLAQKAFGSKIAERMRPHVREFIAEAFAEVETLERVEFVETVARRIPARTILKLLGLPDEIYPRLHQWSIALNAALGGVNLPEPIIVEGEKVLHEMRALFLPEIEKRRANPTDDFISALVTAREDNGDLLAEEELLGLLYVALIAGHDTTANTIALGTAALAQAPEVRAYMRERPDRISEVVMEIMRYIGMSTMMPRLVTEDFDWRGHKLRKGEFVFLMIAGANRDPDVFSDPDRFDPARPQGKNMTFAPGVHFCIGRFLAQVQLHEYFAALVADYDPELLDQRLNFGRSLSFRGVETLNMRLHPRAQAA